MTYFSDHEKHRYELVNEPKTQSIRIFMGEVSVMKLIMDCRTTIAQNFITKLGLKQCDVILTKKTVSADENKNFTNAI